MDLHPYDDRVRRFRHDDPGDQAFARGLVERLLRMPVEAHALRYDLAFFSGGIGINDNLFISIEAAEAWRAKPPAGFLHADEALADEALADDIRWLIMSDEDLEPDAALATFITDHRAPFQAPVGDEMWIEATSGANSWTVAYTHRGWLHWMSQDQG